MDEVFDSSLDGMGTDEFLKIIRYVIKDANVFVISHKAELHDKSQSNDYHLCNKPYLHLNQTYLFF